MPKLPYMPLYIADYLADTVILTPTEDSAYIRLIMHYWQNEGLPSDDERLARIARVSLKEWLRIRSTIASFFGPDWHHKRIEAELAKACDGISKRSAAGKAGAAARYGKRMANADQSHSNRSGNRMPSQNSESPIQERLVSDSDLDSEFLDSESPCFDPETGEWE
jgi:uncharacterized protein YdaU (DUF1376 family)